MNENRTKDSKRKIYSLINGILVLLIVLIAFVLGVCLKDDWIAPKADNTMNLNSWTRINQDGTEEEVYGEFSIGKSAPVTFYRVLPDGISDDRILRIKCPYYSVDAYIEDELIYHAGPASAGQLKTTLGNVFALIPLKSEYSGKKITITVKPRNYGFEVLIKDAAITTMANYAYLRMKECVPYFTLSAILLLISIISIILYATFHVSSAETEKYISFGFLHLGFFGFSAIAWIIADYHIWGMISGRMALSGMINYVGFMLCPLMFSGLLLSVFKKNVFFKILYYISEANFVIQMLLFFFGVIDLPQGLIVSQIIIVLLVFAIVFFGVTMIKNFAKKSFVLLIIPTICFVLFSIIALICYVLNLEWMLFVALALTFFAFAVIDYLLLNLFGALEDNKKFDEVKEIAYHDNLTNAENRRAYDEYINFLNERIKTGEIDETLSTIMMDVNGLKKVNDLLGHAAGDEIIIGAAECISKVFGEYGRCFRTGGDEFVVIAPMEHEFFLRKYEELEKELSVWKGVHVEGISISVGKADRGEFPHYKIEKLLNIADKRMYENKQHYYASLLSVDDEFVESVVGDVKKKRKKRYSDNFALTKYTMPVIRQMAEVIPGGFFIYQEDEKRELIYQNRKVLELFGCNTLHEFKELTGYTFEGMVHPDDFRKIQDSIDTQIFSEDGDGMDHVVYRIIRKDGSVRLIDDYGHFSHSDDYGDIYYVFINDITDKKVD
ncbi:MAG: diguanylate cyclase [Lachnospiraceae bacterium]|nr:diguanylate cyclase [Lachnospiraceae bacterium]